MSGGTRARIAVDARMAGMGGIGRYLESLLEAMLAEGRDIDWTLVGDLRRLERFTALSKRVTLRASTAPIYSFREWAFLGPLFAGADLVHIPHFNAPRSLPSKLVLTVHDLIHFEVPEYLPFPGAAWLLDRRIGSLLGRADAVIVVSEATRAAILQRYPRQTGSRPVRVIHEGAAGYFSPDARPDDADRLRRMAVRAPFYLYIGALREHKQPQHALEAFRRFRERSGTSAQLVICGSLDPRFDRKHGFAERLAADPDVRWIRSADDADLASLYRAARALVMPSRIEGFGLPVLEAMRSGCPVIAADIPSLREVGGDAAIYYPCGQIDALSDALYNVFHDDAKRPLQIQNGLSRAALFSWAAAARQTLDCYQEILKRPARSTS